MTPQVRDPYLDYVIAQTVREVDELSRRRHEMYWGVAGIVGAVAIGLIGFLGLGQLRDIRESVRSGVSTDLRHEVFQDDSPLRNELRNDVVQFVQNYIENRLGQLSQEMTLVRLQILAQRVDSAEKFSHSERDALLTQLLELRDKPAITSRPEYLVALENVIDSFYQAGLWKQLLLIDKELGHIIVEQRGHVITMLQLYEQRIIGDNITDPETLASFERYANACRDLRIPEVALDSRLVCEHLLQRPGWQDRVKELLFDLEHMEPENSARVLDAMQRRTDPSKISKKPDSTTHRMAVRYRSFAEAYANELSAIQAAQQRRAQEAHADAP